LVAYHILLALSVKFLKKSPYKSPQIAIEDNRTVVWRSLSEERFVSFRKKGRHALLYITTTTSSGFLLNPREYPHTPYICRN